MGVAKRLFRWLEVVVFAVFAPVGALAAWGRLTFGRIRYAQIRANCDWVNLPYLPRIYLVWFLVFCLACLAITVAYGLLVFRGLPSGLERRLGIAPRTAAALQTVNLLFLAGLVEVTVWLVFFEFHFPWPGSAEAEYSRCLDDQYVPVAQAEFRFPARKRNLVHVVCESMEDAFARPEFYGEDLMPEMTRLAAENDSFPGCRSVYGTDCTILSLYSGQLALPYLYRNRFFFRYGTKRWPRPFHGSPSLFQVLAANGYQTEYMQGGTIHYNGKDKLYERVPGIRVQSLETLRSDPEYRSQAKRSRWGVNDRILWRHVREELARLGRCGKPYALQILTVDTHFPYPYLGPGEPRGFHDERDVVRAQSRMVGEFLDWLKRQDFYRDTLVVVTGDHVAFHCHPSDQKIRDRLPGFRRTVYNCFVNSSVRPKDPPGTGQGRLWAVFDLMPTILEAMGVTWQGHRLGVGTSLYSGERTWLEKIGEKTYEREIRKESHLYNRLE